MKTKNILVVDDDTICRKHMEFLLCKCNYNVLLAQNGQEAIDFIINKSYIDIIFMDIYMEPLNGIETTLKIRQKNKKVSIIGISAYIDDVDKNKFLISGMNDYIQKPLTYEYIIDKLPLFLKK